MAANRVSRMMEMIEDGVGVNYVCASVGQYTPLIVAVKAQNEAKAAKRREELLSVIRAGGPDMAKAAE